MRRFFASLVVLFLAAGTASLEPTLAAQAGARPVGDASLMPTDAAAPNWKRVENLRVFTQGDLYGYIDGGAELFLELGFDRLTLQKYRNGAGEFAVEIYRMTDPVAATGIYLMKCGKETRDPAFKARHTLNRHQLMFVRDRYYVTINNLSGADRMGPDLLKFGDLVAAKLPADRLPTELERLPVQGLVPGSERLLRGPFGLQSLYTLGEGDILQLGGKIVGVAGNYKGSTGATTLILITYPDAAAAKKAFGNVRQNLDTYLKPATTTATKLVFRDYESKFGIVTLGARQIELKLHLPKAPQ
jgi:hypothetical protein